MAAHVSSYHEAASPRHAKENEEDAADARMGTEQLVVTDASLLYWHSGQLEERVQPEPPSAPGPRRPTA
ncbi:unnamed protein product [Gadus morhua 'NCC']